MKPKCVRSAGGFIGSLREKIQHNPPRRYDGDMHLSAEVFTELFDNLSRGCVNCSSECEYDPVYCQLERTSSLGLQVVLLVAVFYQPQICIFDGRGPCYPPHEVLMEARNIELPRFRPCLVHVRAKRCSAEQDSRIEQQPGVINIMAVMTPRREQVQV